MVKHPEDHRKFWLEKLVKDNNFKVGAELGVHEGVTFKHLIHNCPDLTLYGIDVWDAEYESHDHIIRRNMKPEFERYFLSLRDEFNKNKRAILIKESTFTAHEIIDNKSLDFVFIDADHHYTSLYWDIVNWLPKVKRGGYVTGHDIHQGFTQTAVRETLGEYKTGPDDVWYKQVE